MRTKLNQFVCNIPFFDQDLIILTETWLVNSIHNSELGLLNYEIYRLDREEIRNDVARGGGILIACKRSVPSRIIKTSNTSIETIFVLIEILNKKILVNATYLPPEPSYADLSAYTSLLDEVISNYPDAVTLIFGDFNLPFLKWNFCENIQRLVCSDSNIVSELLLNTAAYHDLFQINYHRNYRDRILDLIFVNCEGSTVRVANDHLLPIDENHPPLEFNVDIQTKTKSLPPSNKHEIRAFSKTKLSELREYFSFIDWKCLCDDSLSLDKQVKIFYETVNIGINHFVPKIKIDNFKFPIWFSKDLKNKTLLKKSLHKEYKEKKCPFIYSQFSQIRRECKSLSHLNYQEYIKTSEINIKEDPRRFFQFVNSKKRNTELPTCMQLGDKIAKTPSEISNLFATHFSSVFSDEVIVPPNFNFENSVHGLSIGEIQYSEVLSKLLKLPPVTSCGPDGVPSFILKECALQLAEPLTFLFNRSIETGYYPKDWKSSYIIPLHKKSNRSLVQNFRGISKISAIPKALESIIYSKLSPHIQKLIVKNQHGFVKSKSTGSNLASFIEFVSPSLENGNQVDCIYSDYSSAFDLVNINILCSKLKSYGLSDISWFYSYLSNRIQIVKYENTCSIPITVNSGCQQGGHLSGLLFNVYINDLPSCIDDSIGDWLFADDYKMATVVKGSANSEQLQHAIDSLVSWCEINRMHLNIKKCQVITFTRKKEPLLFDYYINGEKIARVTEVKDLGVTLTPDLKFNNHYQVIVGKAFKTLGFINRYSRGFESPLTLKTLFCSLIRSSLEYCSTIWSPSYGCHVDYIERVQRRFLRVLAYKMNNNTNNINYKELMNQFNLQTLEHRRDVCDAIFLLKVINNQLNCPELQSQIKTRDNVKNTRNKNPFVTNFCRTNISQNHPINRCIRLWNIISNPPYNLNIYEESVNSLRDKLLKLSHVPLRD